VSGFCIFHDRNYIQDKTNYEEHKKRLVERLKDKVKDAMSNNLPLFCIGYYLPDLGLSDLGIDREYNESVYFSNCQFFGKARRCAFD
jgi:hypothetical protein